MTARKQPGAYLIHFAERLSGHAGHYIGSAADVPARITMHRAGNGAKIMIAVTLRGIDWQIARVWPTETHQLAWQTEIALKNRRNAPRFCPVCHPGTKAAATVTPTSVRTWHRPRPAAISAAEAAELGPPPFGADDPWEVF